MKKNLIYILIAVVVIAILTGGYIFFKQAKSKDLTQTIDKIFLGYSSYIIDMGTSPESLEQLSKNTQKSVRWKGPYLSESIISDYKKGKIKLIKATNIPTKTCGIDTLTNCFVWIAVDGFSSSDFSQIKLDLNKKTPLFFADKKLFFMVTRVE